VRDGAGAISPRVGVAIAAIAAATADYAITTARVPSAPQHDASTDLFLERIARIRDLQDGFDLRSWGYALVLAAVAGDAVRMRARTSPPDERRRLFANVGVAGVLLVIAVSAGRFAHGIVSTSIEIPAGPAYLVPVALFVVAAVGGIHALVASGEPMGAAMAVDRRTQWRRVLRHGALVALALTAVTVTLAVIYSGQQGPCGGAPVEGPDWADALARIAVGTALAAVALAIAGLVVRRWFVAMVCLVVNPGALVYMLLSSCAFS
jgi:hypothetical protein